MAERLPIYDLEAEILRRLREHHRLIVQAPTGSGKSTQVPQMLLQQGLLGDGQAVVLQPRRLAARLLAARVAAEMGVPLGREVGYSIRFENVTSAATRIRYVTEGILLRQMVEDPELRGINAILFDEFHERHLYGDITLARALTLQEQLRPDLKLLVMSATLDTRLLYDYLQPCAVVTSAGRMFPVDIEYLPARSGGGQAVWDLAAEALARALRQGGEGDVLVFMPGAFEIQQTLETVRQLPEARGMVLLPLHGELPPHAQDAAVARYAQRKIVVATNVAETSLTIDGVRLVIDSGLARIPRYDPNRGINTLFIEKISRASAEQRAGRAGRTAPGRCLRLWSAQEHWERPAQETPEVKRLELSEVVLTLKAAGVEDLQSFKWLEPPPAEALAHAVELLTDLGALDTTGRLTTLGRKMLAFPVHPRYARLLLAAADYHCVPQAALMAALTQGRDLLARRLDRVSSQNRDDLLGEKAESDFFLLMRAWNYAVRNDFRPEACHRVGVNPQAARQVGPLQEQFLRIAAREGLPVQAERVSDEALCKCLLAAFADRVARRVDMGTLRCELVHGRKGILARDSVVHHSPLLVAAEIREVEAADKTIQTLLSLATAIKPEWLQELFPGDIQEKQRLYYDPADRRVYAEACVMFRDLPLATRKVEPPPPEAAAPLLAAEVAAGRLTLKQWDHEVEQWILRLNFLARVCPELGLPPLEEQDRLHLIEQVCHGAFTYKDIKDRPVKPVVQSWLSPAQQDLLNRHAPERVDLGNGRRPKVVYAENQPPYIAARIQELFGLDKTPRIALGKVTLTVHILAPNMRPVQITQDLAGFWREHYPRIKQELQRKYPKHEWR
ncbi:MAG: ATP-dependent helicase HrpB [Verrucomicrobiae bacterium]|nr:ATP-dependent helicase HrpB [Verrucomicrobiae bacterium]